jgi:hypothetical protein
MTARMLFYEKAVPVNRERHSDCSVDIADYKFCRGVNSVPLMAAEFTLAALEYPIVFAREGEAVHPVVILGLRSRENLYVSDSGAWLGKYIPAFVRRYPFVFSASEDGGRFLLCVDEAFSGFRRDGRGERLFGDDGEPTPYVSRVLRFLQDYRAQFLRTRDFGRRLSALGLLESMQALVPFADGQISLRGFNVVNRRKLRTLAGEQLAELARADELQLVYLHLQSLRNFDSVRERLPMLMPVADDAPPTGRRAPQPIS